MLAGPVARRELERHFVKGALPVLGDRAAKGMRGSGER